MLEKRGYFVTFGIGGLLDFESAESRSPSPDDGFLLLLLLLLEAPPPPRGSSSPPAASPPTPLPQSPFSPPPYLSFCCRHYLSPSKITTLHSHTRPFTISHAAAEEEQRSARCCPRTPCCRTSQAPSFGSTIHPQLIFPNIFLHFDPPLPRRQPGSHQRL
jgi:hypothetical protein